MALTETDQKRVIRALDYPAQVLIPDSIYYNTNILRLLKGHGEYETAEIVSLLDAIDAQKADMRSKSGRDNIKQIESIVFDTEKGRKHRSSELLRLKKELSSYIGLAINSKSNMGNVCL